MGFARSALGIALILALGAPAYADVAPEPVQPPQPSPAKIVKGGYKVVDVAIGLDHPYSIAFLPDGAMLVTERAGRLKLIRGTTVSPPIAGVPAVLNQGQGGLFDVVLHPNFAQNSLLYLTYAAGTEAANGTRVARARFDGTALHDLKVI